MDAGAMSTQTAAFVGRERELERLATILDEALAGRGNVTMVVGEAGIGKSRTARELAARAVRRGAVVLWGSCYEGNWSPPYGPWVEALATYARAVPPERLRERV